MSDLPLDGQQPGPDRGNRRDDRCCRRYLRRSEIALAGPSSIFPLRYLAYIHLAVAILFFLYFYPLWTGLPVSDLAYLNEPGGLWPGKMWFPSWI